jgi:hypothetical protein
MKEDKQFSWLPKQLDQHGAFFRPISPETYPHFGIDPQDVPMGTFAAEDHPSFLPSRFGGNAYGLGLIEQSALSRNDTDFLESLDFRKQEELARNAGRLNRIYQKLGLLIRFSSTGNRYFLIPINLVAHSLQDIKTKADVVEELVLQHTIETRRERLDIGLMTASHDLIVHELTARLSNHRIFLFESMDKIRSWRAHLDMIVLPKDLFEYVLEQSLPRGSRSSLKQRRLFSYAMYVAGKIFDLIEPDGRFVMLAHFPYPEEDTKHKVRFKSEEELRSFLLFSHIFKTKKNYSANGNTLEVSAPDLYYYMRRFPYSDAHLRRLLGDLKIEDLSIEDINKLSYVNIRLPQPYIKRIKKQWEWIFTPYFETIHMASKSPGFYREYWEERLEIDGNIPENFWLFVGQPRKPAVTLASLEDEAKASGMMGCSLPLVAEYRNSFRFVLDVLRNVIRIRNNDFPKLTELERIRISNPFITKNENFNAILRLLAQIPKLEAIHDFFNPDHIEGQTTPLLENLPKLSLHGFTPAQLKEILLIVVGYTTMSRVVFGKLPAKTLKPITDKAKAGNYQEIVKVLRICRLMSMAQLAGALGGAFTSEQVKELFLLYDDAIQVATDPELDWNKLNDLRISMLGGVQNKAVREMLKLFNLFEFLNDWQELREKGAFQREVVCDYSSRKSARLTQVLELSDIAVEFKQHFTESYIFGQSYFFRQFLDIEFHGTGHLFPKLGTKAGFILLWLTVNAAERRIVNFNPMLSQTPQDRYEQRIQKIREVLLRIPIGQLKPKFFESIKRTLADGRPAFIFDSGIRLMCNPKTRTVDVSFVDVKENIQAIDGLLNHFESQKLHGISLRNLQYMERLFSELESFNRYLRQEADPLECDAPSGPDSGNGAEAKDTEIKNIEARLKLLIESHIFIPEDVYDTITVLASNCPEILRFVLPEFHDFGNLVEKWPARKSSSPGFHIMRCLQKFQALITKNRDAFQDLNTFYQSAKHEFGPLAEEGIGASHAQIETLELLIERIQQRPLLYKALTTALLFQDIGKIGKYNHIFPHPHIRISHAEDGAAILRKCGILDKYQLEAQLHPLAALLVQHHGLIGHVIQGEEPATVLNHLTDQQDDRLLDAYVVHAVLAAAAVEEGLMISDLLDLFLSYRATALQIIKSQSSWQGHLREALRKKGKAVLDDFALAPAKLQDCVKTLDCFFIDDDIEDEALWRGRLIAALERLLRLLGVAWVDYQDLQMHLLKMPTNFIYHKKRLKSVGLAAFENQLGAAAKILDAVSSLHSGSCFYILYCLDHLGGALRVHDFLPFTRFLSVEECLKLLFAAFQVFHQHWGKDRKGGFVSFRQLSHVIERRHTAVRCVLQNMPVPEGCSGNGQYSLFSHPFGTLRFQVHENSGQPIVEVVFEDAVRMYTMLQSLVSQRTHEELTLQYQTSIDELKELPFDTEDYRTTLAQAYEKQQERINDSILKVLREQLNEARNFHELQHIQEEIEEKESEVRFSEEQQFLLKDIFDFHRARIRDQYLDQIFHRIDAIESKEEILSYWNTIKYDLLDYRSYVGKEYESLIAEFIEHKIEEI